jgi:hypothetical protein
VVSSCVLVSELGALAAGSEMKDLDRISFIQLCVEMAISKYKPSQVNRQSTP